MTKAEIIRYFGWQSEACRQLGIRNSSMSVWKEVPPLRQLQVEILTKGLLLADPALKLPGGRHNSRLKHRRPIKR